MTNMKTEGRQNFRILMLDAPKNIATAMALPTFNSYGTLAALELRATSYSQFD